MVSTPFCKRTAVRPVLTNADSPISLSPFPNFTVVSDDCCANAYLPIDTSLSLNSTVLSFEGRRLIEKALSPMDSRFGLNFNEVKL